MILKRCDGPCLRDHLIFGSIHVTVLVIFVPCWQWVKFGIFCEFQASFVGMKFRYPKRNMSSLSSFLFLCGYGCVCFGYLTIIKSSFVLQSQHLNRDLIQVTQRRSHRDNQDSKRRNWYQYKYWYFRFCILRVADNLKFAYKQSKSEELTI